MYIFRNKPLELHLYLAFFVAARAGVTRAPRPHAAASNRRTFLPIVLRFSLLGPMRASFSYVLTGQTINMTQKIIIPWLIC